MKKKQSQKIWVYKPQAPKFSVVEKTKTLAKVQEIIEQLPKLAQKISRLDMRGNRIYLYELMKQSESADTTFMEELIDNRHLEFPYARITVHTIQGDSCPVDWQRHNNQWITLYTGTLLACMNHIEKDDDWF